MANSTALPVDWIQSNGGAEFYWNSQDNGTNGVYISTWPDRIQGVQLVQGTAAHQPYNIPCSGVRFYGNQWMDIANNVVTLKTNATITNIAVAVYFNWDGDTGGTQTWLTDTNARYATYGGSGFLYIHHSGPSTGILQIDEDVDQNTYALSSSARWNVNTTAGKLLCASVLAPYKGAGGNNYDVYTNGVDVGDSVQILHTNFTRLGANASGGSGLIGDVAAIIIATNITSPIAWQSNVNYTLSNEFNTCVPGNCTPSLPSGAVAYYDVLCPSSMVLNSTNTAVLTLKSLAGNHAYDVTNNLLNAINTGDATWITGAVYHASGSLNSNLTANIYFDRQKDAANINTLNEAFETGAGTNVAQPFTFLMVAADFAHTNGNQVTTWAEFNGASLQNVQSSISLNTTPNGRIQGYQGGAGTLLGGFTVTTNWVVLTGVFNGTTSYIRTNGSLYVYADGGTTAFTCNGYPFIIGADKQIAWYAFGRFGIWNRELNTNEIQSIETKARNDFGI